MRMPRPVALWLLVTGAMFVVSFAVYDPEVGVYSTSHPDGSGIEVFVRPIGVLAAISLVVGVVVLLALWVRKRWRNARSQEPNPS